MLSIDYTIDDHTSSTEYTEYIQDQHESAIRGFGARGARFVAQARYSKGSGLRKGWNQPQNTLSTDQAIKALRRGRNIGLAAGSGDVYCFDFDAGADRGHECSWLGGTIYTYRENATDRAKIFFTCRDRLPKRAESNDVGLQGWTTTDNHTNAVIAGYPNSGAPILWGGVQLVELDGETAAALWDEWTGRELSQPDQATEALNVDPDESGADLLAAAIEQAGHGNRNSTGFALASALRDRRVSHDDAKGYMLAYQKAVTERMHPYSVQEALQSLRSAYSRPARELSPVADRIAFHEDVLKAQSFWLSAEGAETLVSVGVTKDSGQAIVTALLDIMAEWGRPDVWPGLRTWADVAGVALSTLQKHSERLIEAGIIAREAPKDEGAAFTFTVDLHYRYTPPEVLQTDATAKQHLPSLHTVPILSFYSEHRTDDAFRNNHAAYKRRKPNGLDPLGRTALIVAFRLLDGAATVREIAAATGRNEQTIRRALKRAFDYGLLTFATERHNTRRYELLPEWLDDLKTLRRQMTTYGVQFEREYQTAEKALAWALKRKASPKRIAALQAKVNRYAKAEGWDGDDPASWVLFRRGAHSWLRWDTAERDRDLAQVRDEVQRLTLGGCDVSAIMRMLTMGGYDAADVSRALVARSQAKPLCEYTNQESEL